jgi:hypothetical protein
MPETPVLDKIACFYKVIHSLSKCLLEFIRKKNRLVWFNFKKMR